MLLCAGHTPFEVFYGHVSNCELHFLTTENNSDEDAVTIIIISDSEEKPVNIN